MFEPQLGKSIKVYIDDMVVKSKVVSEHVRDLGDIFEILRRYKLRLNASKCSFYGDPQGDRGKSLSNQGCQ